jgi:5-oxoprolinase (ATP-hydrolysing)
VTIQSPQLDINTVAAGGGSRLFFKNGLFVVGPESAGAHPGPVCYRKGGPLTITDANVLLGRIQPHLFPSIFGPHENERLDYNSTKEAFQALMEEINNYSMTQGDSGLTYTIDQVAAGFIRVANETMARPIRNLTTMKGRDVTKHSLAAFGGAGPQHCCALAKSLGIRKVFISKYSGILSAYGLSLADVVIDKQEPCGGSELSITLRSAIEKLNILDEKCREELSKQNFEESNMTSTYFINCRYNGTDTSMMINVMQVSPNNQENNSYDVNTLQLQDAFVNTYKQEYGFELKDRSILIDDIRVRVIGHSATRPETELADNITLNHLPHPQEYVSVYFDDTGRVNAPVYLLTTLASGNKISGPAIIIQDITTIVVEPSCVASINKNGDVLIDILSIGESDASISLDPIYLSIFSHR